MIFNYPIFVEGLLIPLLGLGVLVIYKKSKKILGIKQETLS